MGMMMGSAAAGAVAASGRERSWPARGAGAVLRRALVGLAARAPARVFVLEGLDSPAGIDALRLRDDVRILESPRSAMVLLVSGHLPPSLHEAAQRAHDALAHPRATVWWTGTPSVGTSPFPNATVVVTGEGGADMIGQLAGVLVQVHQELIRGARVSEPAQLADVDPAPWRGVGPFGQGGAGMTGGLPFGRPMAGRAADRDGLELDQLPVRVGPFFSSFPPGLVLDVRLQGDVVQDVVVPGNVFAGSSAARDVVALSALDGAPIPIAILERSRARHHLRWLAHALRVHGLEALARRALTLAAALARGLPPGAHTDVLALARLLERTRALAWATGEVGVTAAALLADRGLGPVARAAGLAEDARLADPAYTALGFEPVVARGGAGAGQLGDARARWRQRVAEAAQSLDLAARAGDRQGGAGGLAIEGPRGRARRDVADPGGPSGACLALLPALLRDQDWGDAVTTVVSLDIDVREAAGGASPLAPLPPPRISGGMGGMGRAGMGMGGTPGMRGKEMTGAGGESPPREEGPDAR